MNNSRNEYLEADRPPHEKPFTLQKTPDPDNLAIFDARRAAFAEPRRRMDRAKYMFAELIDRAMNPRCPGFIRKGSVVVPDSELARKFQVWESTIYTWKKQLENCGYVWTSKQYRSNAWPITIYHITALHARPTSTQNQDGSSNYAPGRSAPDGIPGRKSGKVGMGARKPGQKSLPLASPVVPPVPWNDPARAAEKLKLREIVAAGLVVHWLPATAGTGSQPQSAPAESHDAHRLTATAGTGPQPQPTRADSHGARGATATVQRGVKRVSVKSKSNPETRGKGTPPPDLEDFKKQWRGSYRRERLPVLAKLKADRDHAAEKDRPWFQERIDFLTWMDTGGKPPTVAPRPIVYSNLSIVKPEKLDAKEAELARGYARRLKVQVAA